MSNSKKLIQKDLEIYRASIEQYKAVKGNDEECLARGRTAYNNFSSVIDRVTEEKKSGSLSKSEKQICDKVVENKFLKGINNIRVIAQHAHKKGEEAIEFYSPKPSSELLQIPADTSAAALFSSDMFSATNMYSNSVISVSHLDCLERSYAILAKELKVFD